MSVIVELSIPDEEFLLGRVLADPPGMRIELERIVPTVDAVIPFLWVRGEDHESFERRVGERDAIGSFQALDRPGEWVLYRTEWADEPFSLLAIINESRGVILEGIGNDGWTFRLRFPNHDALSTFYNHCMEQDINIHIDRSYTLTEKTEFGHQFGLSRQQREALILAFRTGYFDSPSQTSLAAIAEKFDISEQAVSDRIRRGNRKILREALFPSGTDSQ
jgi:hypothetical protein